MGNVKRLVVEIVEVVIGIKRRGVAPDDGDEFVTESRRSHRLARYRREAVTSPTSHVTEKATVNDQSLSRDVGRVIGGEESNSCRHLFGQTLSTHRHGAINQIVNVCVA